MDLVEKKVENQVQFWSLLGPFFVLLSIAVLLFKVSPHWYFPVSALISLPLCVKWKTKGMAVALGCLLLLSGISFQTLELDDRYWHVGLSLAMAFSFIVLTLSLEEVQGLISKLLLESHSRLDNFLLLDEKWKSAELTWSFEKEKAKSEVGVLTLEIARVQEDKETFYKLAQLAKDELVQVRGQHDLLLQDLVYKKQQIAQLHERLDESEQTVQEFVNSDAEKQIQTLEELNSSLDREKATLKAKVSLIQAERENWEIEKEQMIQELRGYRANESLCLSEQKRSAQEKQEQQEAFLALSYKCEQIQREMAELVYTHSTLIEQNECMRNVDEQYRQTIDTLRNNIIGLEAKILSAENEKEVLRSRRREIEELLLNQQNQAKVKDEQYKITLEQVQNKFEEEKRKTENQFKQGMQHLLHQGQQEMGMMQERYHHLSEALLKTKDELEIARQHLIQVEFKEKRYQESIAELKEELEVNKNLNSQFVYDCQEKEKVLAEEISYLRHHYRSVEQNLIDTQIDLEEKNEVIILIQQRMDELRGDLIEQEGLFRQSVEQNQKIEQIRSSLEQRIEQAEVELKEARELLEVKQQKREREKQPDDTAKTRCVDAMYNQLKEQFQEKCKVLDATRRELFRAHEELLRFQKEYEEENLYNQPANEQHLQRHLVCLDKQFDLMQANYQEEIDDLTQLISDLLKPVEK